MDSKHERWMDFELAGVALEHRLGEYRERLLRAALRAGDQREREHRAWMDEDPNKEED